jgi:hypothetical protein
MDKYVHVQENIFFGLMTKHNNTPYPYTVSIYMIMSIGNHECSLLVDKYPGSDNPRVDKVRLGLWCLTPLQQYLSYIWWSVLLMKWSVNALTARKRPYFK